MTTRTAREQALEAREAMAKVLDAKFQNIPEWQAFRAIDRAVSALEVVPDPTPAPAVRSTFNVTETFKDGVLTFRHHRADAKPSYVALAHKLLEDLGKPVPTPKLIDYICEQRGITDREKAKINISSAMSKDDSIKSVEWANGRAWWWANQPVPKTDLEKLLE